MTRAVLLFVTVVTICDAALIPISPSWPSSVCARAYGGTSSNPLACLSKPCASDIDYNFLLNMLYPDARFASSDEAALSLIGAYSRSGRCDFNECFRGGCPELNICGQCIDYEPFRSNFDCRGLYCNNGCDCYSCDCYPGECYSSECYPKCLSGCLGCCTCGYCRKIPRCCPYGGKKITGQCFPGPNSCI